MKAAFNLALFLLLLASGCAQVKAPTGGPLDNTAPGIAQSIPTDGSTEFNGREITVIFSEKIRLISPNKKVLISPPFRVRPTIKQSGADRVSILLNESARPNTTYTINLNEAIEDITEGNQAKDATLVFSTGAFLDSAWIQGRSLDAYSLEPDKEIPIILHTVGDTSNITNAPPYYLARTDESGTFTMRNLRPGKYTLHALGDLNGNNQYDLPGERIAFLDSVLILTDSIASIDLRTCIVESEEQVLRDVIQTPAWGLQLITAKASDAISIRAISDVGRSSEFMKEYNPGSDTTTFWPRDTTLLTGARFQVLDGAQVIDTISFRPSKKPPFHLSLTLIGGGRQDRITLRADRPLSELDTSRIQWMPDSLGKVSIVSVDSLDLRTRTLGFTDRRSDVLRLLPGAFTAIIGSESDTTIIRDKAISPDQLGALTIAFSESLPNGMIIQLINAKNVALRETTAPESAISWNGIHPGTYRLRTIEDRNGNGRWDTGNWQTRTQPERISIDTEPIMIRAGWKVEITWP